MQHRARGPRPVFFADPQLDRFHIMLVALVQEVAVLRDRLDTVERLAARGERITPEAIDSYVPSEDEHEARDRVRTAYIERVLRVVFEEAEQMRAESERFATVEDVVESVSS